MPRAFLLVVLATFAGSISALTLDYGDAPSPYVTAHHTQMSGTGLMTLTRLGQQISDDTGLSNPVPGGWNGDGGDDGIVISNFRKGATATIDVYTWFAVGNYDCYAVWCDFNNDGVWDTPSERVLIRGAGAPGFGITVGKNTDTFVVPMTAVGTHCKIRARIWNAGYTGGATFGYGGPSSPTGNCIGGECEDYDLPYDGDPEIDVEVTTTTPPAHFIQSGGSDKRGRLTMGTPSTFSYMIYNKGAAASLSVSGITISALTGGTATLVGTGMFGIGAQGKQAFSITVTPSAARVTFNISIASNDTTGSENPFVINVTGAVGMSGAYTISNAGGAPDFSDIGAAFDELELAGVNGPCTFTISAGATPYTSSASYGLGFDNLAGAAQSAPVYGVSATNTLTFKAATGQRPKISGDGAKFYWFWTMYTATIAIGTQYVTLEGLECQNGQQYGIVGVQNTQNGLEYHNFTVRQCIIHDYADGAGICMLGASDNMLVENNFIWGCGVGNAPMIYGFSTGSQNLVCGAMNFWWCSPTNTRVRHNTVLMTNGVAAAPAQAGCVGFLRCYVAEHIGNIYVQKTPVVTGKPDPVVMWIHDAGNEPGVSNYNGYYAQTGTFIGGTSSVTGLYPNFGQWQFYGRDSQGFNTDPMLISTTGTPNLHIQGGSPGVDRVTTLSTTAVDIDGDARPLGSARDSGADEITPVTPGIEVRETSTTGPVITSGQAASGGRDFGARDIAAGASNALPIVIRNTGTANLVLGTPTLGGTHMSEFILDTTGFTATVAPGANTSFTVAFDPASTGAKTANVSFTHNASGTSPFVVNFAGNGVQNVAVIEVRETSVTGIVISNGAAASGGRDFGVVDLSAMPTAALTIVVRNTGTGAMTLGTPALGGADAASFVLDISGTQSNVSPGANTTFTVAFDSATLGVKNASVSFSHNDASTATPFTFALRGTATTNNLPTITTASPLANGRANVAYSPLNFAATGGFTPYTWSIAAGNLPPGMNLSSTGTFSGTPSQAGAYTFDVRVTDNVGSQDTKQFTLTIDISMTVGGGAGSGSGGGGGCAAGSSNALWLAALALALAAIRLTRRKA